MSLSEQLRKERREFAYEQEEDQCVPQKEMKVMEQNRCNTGKTTNCQNTKKKPGRTQKVYNCF